MLTRFYCLPPGLLPRCYREYNNLYRYAIYIYNNMHAAFTCHAGLATLWLAGLLAGGCWLADGWLVGAGWLVVGWLATHWLAG